MFSSHHFLIRGQSSAYLNDCSLVPSFEERILGIGRLADQRRAAAELNAPHLCLYSPMMCLIKSLRDVERGQKGGEYEDAAQRDMAFLPLCEHVNIDLQSKRNAFTHPDTLSLSFSLFFHGHNYNQVHRKKCLALFLYYLAGDPEAEPRGSKERHRAPISCPKPSALANEKKDGPIRFHCGQTTRLS